MEEIGKTNEELSIELDTLKQEYRVLKAKYENDIIEYKNEEIDLSNSEEKLNSPRDIKDVKTKIHDEYEIKKLFDDYIRMYATRDDLLTNYFSDNFSGFTGGGDFLVKDKKEWIDITRQDFSQVKESIRIEHKDLSIQLLSESVAVTTSFFTIHLPIKDHILSRETARLVLIFRKESDGWKITHSSISIPYHLVLDGEVYPLKNLEERNRFLEEMVIERTAQISSINSKLEKKNEELVNEIASRKLVESELLESETRLLSLVNNLEAGVVVHAADTSIVMNNSRASELLGLTNDQMKGKAAIDPAWKFVNEDHTPIPLNEYPVNRILNLKQPIKNQIMGVHHPDKDGFVWAVVNGFPTLNDADEITEILISFIDITERKRLEEELSNSKARLQRAEFTSKSGNWELHLDSNIMISSEGAEILYGLRGEQFEFAAVRNIPLPEYRPLLDNALRKLIENGEPYNIEFKIQNAETGKIMDIHSVAEYNKDERILFGVIQDITQRKQTEEAVRNSDERHRRMVTNISDVIGIIGVNGIMQYKSPNIEKWFGWLPEDLVGTDGWLTVHPDDLERIQKEFFSLLEKNNASITIEYKYKCKDGNYKPIELTATNLINDNVINGVLLNYHDITDRKIAEEKVRQKDIQFRKLSANVHDLIFQFTRRPDGTYCVPIASEGIKNIFGCSPEDVIEDFTPIGKVIYSEDVARVIEDIEYSAKHLTYFTCEFRVQIPGKPIQWIYSKSSPEKLPDGSITWYGFNADITERKLAEEKIKETKLLLKASIESPKDMIILSIDKNYQYLYFNSFHQNVMKISYGKVIKIGMNLLDCITSEDDRNKAKYNYDLALDGLSHITVEEFGDLERSYYETRYNTIFNESGEVIGATAFSANITERKRIEIELDKHRNHLEELVDLRTAELDNANDLLKREIEKEKEYELLLQQSLAKEKELSEMKSRFISTTSHEFRTPLTSILSSSGLLKRYSNKWDEDKKNEHFERIENSISYLVKLLDDTLTISHADSGRINFDPELIDLKQLVEECIVDAQNFSSFHQIKLSNKPLHTKYLLDQKLMRFILNNLLTNAIKYSPMSKDVILSISTNDNHLIIEVCDKGMGIPKQEIGKIFESFYRTKNVGEIRGTGLGLAIVKRAVELHGGEVNVSSELNIGTTFTVKIPVKKIYQ